MFNRNVFSKKVVGGVFSLLVLFGSISEVGAIGLTGTVVRVLVDDTAYGGCMAQIRPGPESVDGACAAAFVTFDCNNSLGLDGFSKAVANSKLAAAQLAYVSGRPVYVNIDTTRTINGYCYARRIDNR